MRPCARAAVEDGPEQVALVRVGLDRSGGGEPFDELVGDATCEAAAEGAGERRAPRAAAEQLGLVLGGRCRFVGGEERRADLHSLGTQRKRGDDPPGVGDAAGGDDRRPYLLDGDPDQRQRPDQRVLRLRQEGSAMTARLGSRRDDDVDAGLVESHCLVGRRGGPEGDDSGVPEGGEHTLVGDAEDER